MSARWTIKEDIEALLFGIEAGELVEVWREWVAAADDLARILRDQGLKAPQNADTIRARDAYWDARTREVAG